MRRAIRHVAVLVTMVAACVVPATAQVAYDRVLGLATFDRAWEIVYETHFDTTFNGIDWVALKDELRPRAAGAEDLAGLRVVLRTMLARLGQSHFALIPREAADTLDPEDDPGIEEIGDLGLDVRLLGDDVVVTGVDDGSPAHRAGIQRGWIVRSVDGRALSDLVTEERERESRYPAEFSVWRRALARVNGRAGTEVGLDLLDARDRPVTLRLTRRREPSRPVKFGNMPTFFSRFGSRQVKGPGGIDVGVLWFNFWMIPLARQIDSAVHVFRELDGIVVDLRGNRGGLGAMAMGVAGHFLDDRISLGTFKTRTTALRIVANPRRVSPDGQRVVPFDGPVAILIDETSASASEMFAGGMQAIGRARVFGGTSLGAVLPAVFDRLPNRDVLYHAFAEFTTSADVRLEGRGVVPDEEVVPTREALLAGRDPVLDAALAWIAAERAAERDN